MPSLVAPAPISSVQHGAKASASQDFYNSLSSTLATKADRRPSTPQQDDYFVPAPPPPSPVSFRPEHWPTSIRR